MLAFTISVGLHPLWCYIFSDKKLVGIAIAGCITNVTTYVLINTFLRYSVPEAIHWPNKSSFKNLKEYIYLGLPNVICASLQFWFYESIQLISGFIGPYQQAC